jgi:hypothetical protein
MVILGPNKIEFPQGFMMNGDLIHSISFDFAADHTFKLTVNGEGEFIEATDIPGAAVIIILFADKFSKRNMQAEAETILSWGKVIVTKGRHK